MRSILTAQSQRSKKLFSDTGASAGDILTPAKHPAVPHLVADEILQSSTVTNLTFGGGDNIFELRNMHYTSSPYLSLTFTAPTVTAAVYQLSPTAAPTAGFWNVSITSPITGRTYITDGITFNAIAANVQAFINGAIQAVEPNASVVVTGGDFTVPAQFDITYAGTWIGYTAPAAIAFNGLGNGLQTAAAAPVGITGSLLTPGMGFWTEYPAMAAIERVVIRHGNARLHEYDYSVVMNYLKNVVPEGAMHELLESAGGRTFTSGTVCVPLPCFFDRLRVKGFSTPLPPGLNDKIKFEIRFRDLANLLPAGATIGTGTVVRARLYAQEITAEDMVVARHGAHAESPLDTPFAPIFKALDYETRIDPVLLPTATLVRYRLDFLHGDVSSVGVVIIPVATRDTAHQYFRTAVRPSQFIVELDNERIQEQFEASEQEERIQQVMAHRTIDYSTHQPGAGYEMGQGETLGRCTLWSATIDEESSVQGWAGSYPTTQGRDIEVVLQQNSGVDCYVHFVGLIHAMYRVSQNIVMLK